MQDGERQPKQRNDAHHRSLFARLAEPRVALFVGSDVFGPQLLDIGESQPGQATEDENIPHVFEPQARHRFGDERLYLPLRQVLFRRRGDLLELVALKRIFLDPLVPQTIENEIAQAIQNIDRSVVVAAMRCLQKGVEAVEVAVGHLCQPNILFAILLPRIFMQVTAESVIFVGGQLRDAHADLLLALLAVEHQLGQQHANLLAGTLQTFLDLDGIALVAFGLQRTVNLDHPCAKVVDVCVHLVSEFVASRRTAFGLVPLIYRRAALGIDLSRDSVYGNARQNRSHPLARAYTSQKERDVKCFSVHFNLFLTVNTTIEKLRMFAANRC